MNKLTALDVVGRLGDPRKVEDDHLRTQARATGIPLAHLQAARSQLLATATATADAVGVATTRLRQGIGSPPAATPGPAADPRSLFALRLNGFAPTSAVAPHRTSPSLPSLLAEVRERNPSWARYLEPVVQQATHTNAAPQALGTWRTRTMQAPNTRAPSAAARALIAADMLPADGIKTRDHEHQLSANGVPILDEKWLSLGTTTGIDDLKRLAERALDAYPGWQKLHQHPLDELVETYRTSPNASVEGVPIKQVLERERDNARWDNTMALFSAIAYLPPDQIKAFLVAFGFAEGDILVIDEHDTDTQGFVATMKLADGQPIAIEAWRGTESLRDWGTNLLAVPSKVEDGLSIHRGIEKALAKPLEQLEAFLQAKGNPRSVVTGHSLGGGLANGSLPFLRAGGHEVARLTTFGAERSLSGREVEALTDELSAGASRWISHTDPVSLLPPWMDSIGTVFYFHNEHGPDEIKRDRSFLEVLKGLGERQLPVGHHSLDCYLFKTRQLSEYLDHALGARGEYTYEYPG